MLGKLMITAVCGCLISFSMLMSGQNVWDYYSLDLLLSLLLASIAYGFTCRRTDVQTLLALLKQQKLEKNQCLRLLSRIQHSWRFVFSLTLLLFLVQSVQMLSRAGDPKVMSQLGAWLALALLGGLYLSLLRWTLFLPLEAALKRRLFSQSPAQT